MSLLLLGASIAVVLAIALAVDLRDRKRGGRPSARGNGPSAARWEALRKSSDPSLEGMKGFQRF